jgi:betaine-aldehyde dehydrogenase
MATAVRTLQNFIGGEYVDASADESFDVVNPATGDQLAAEPLSTSEDVDRAVEAARSAFESFEQTTPADRATLLLKLADALEEHGDEITELEVANAGKPIEAFKADEIPAMSDCLRFFAGAARTLQGPTAGEYLEGYTSMIRREPIGVVGQITPWNYPLMMAIWKIGPAIAGGNTIVIKPAETTPLSTLRFAEIAAGILPPGVLNVVLGAGATGEAIVRHPDVGRAAITGSV